MSKELIKTWVEALRSGKYEQGTFVLRSKDDKFCCLGVLCDVVKDLVGLDWEKNTSTYIIGNSEAILPLSVVNCLGDVIAHDERILIPKTNSKLQEYLGDKIDAIIKQTTLVALNDYYHLSFDQIADVLEEEFLLSGTINEDETINVA